MAPQFALDAGRDFLVGEGPFRPATADLDGDEDLDVVTPHLEGNLSLLRNQGDGTFADEVRFRVGGIPGALTSVEAGDLDGDQDLDLVVAKQGSLELSVMRNSGVGRFTSQATLPVGNAPISALEDFDGDGDLDVGCAYLRVVPEDRLAGGQGRVSVFLNDGGGTFAAGSEFSVVETRAPGPGFFQPFQPLSMACGDFDQNGAPDLVVANVGANDLSFLLNDGRGAFLTLRMPTDRPPTSVATGDLDGDDRLDLVVVDQAFVSPLFNIGDATFVQDRGLDAGGGSTAVVADFDGDELLDVAVSRAVPGTVFLFLNEGTFERPPATSAVQGWPAHLASGDLDRDGLPDIVTANHYSNSVTVLLNDGQGRFPSGPSVFATGGFGESVAAADFDGDGDLDLATANAEVGPTDPGSNAVSVLLNHGTGGFAPAQHFDAWRGPQGIALGDLDDDGDQDIAVISGLSAVALLANEGDATFSQPRLFGLAARARSMVAGDFNQDGALDLAAAVHIGVALRLSGIDGTSSLEHQRFRSTHAITAADIDGDNDLDLATTRQDTSEVAVLLNDGEAGFAELRPFSSRGKRPRSIAAGDFDGDGDMDLVVANADSDMVVLFKDSGGLEYRPTSGIEVAKPFGVAAADVDGDDDLDVIVAGRGETQYAHLSVALNSGEGNFAPPFQFGSGDAPYAVTAADLDADGRLDLAVVNGGTVIRGEVSIFLNRTTPPLTKDLDSNGVPDECEKLFRRGDCDGDGEVGRSVADAVFVLNFNFLNGAEPECLSACDANDDGAVSGSVSDAVYLLNFAFLRGPPPPAPFPDCGTTESAPVLGCVSSRGCL